MVAYHSALIFDVRGVSKFDTFQAPEVAPADAAGEVPGPLNDLLACYRELSKRNLRECYHDAAQAYEQAISLFNLGHLTLDQRAWAERIYWASCARIERLSRSMTRVPDELADLSHFLCDTYFCNLSIFQSLPDSWAVDQVFPIMPIHRLIERPTRHGTLADISCDSDGKIDRFIGVRDEQHTLPLHPMNGKPYLLGAFLVGAYQEILGDMHNLFGDTHVVHVGLDNEGHVNIDKVVPGERVADVLRYVEFSAQELAEQMRQDAERAVKRGRASPAEAARFMRYYEAGLKGYTYLEDSSVD
jgi:arginine decarboxylase